MLRAVPFLSSPILYLAVVVTLADGVRFATILTSDSKNSGASQFDESLCRSLEHWTDSQLRDCDWYAKRWCRDGPGTELPLDCEGMKCRFQDFATNGISALEACCPCGGGESTDLPEDIPAQADRTPASPMEASKLLPAKAKSALVSASATVAQHGLEPALEHAAQDATSGHSAEPAAAATVPGWLPAGAVTSAAAEAAAAVHAAPVQVVYVPVPAPVPAEPHGGTSVASPASAARSVSSTAPAHAHKPAHKLAKAAHPTLASAASTSVKLQDSMTAHDEAYLGKASEHHFSLGGAAGISAVLFAAVVLSAGLHWAYTWLQDVAPRPTVPNNNEDLRALWAESMDSQLANDRGGASPNGGASSGVAQAEAVRSPAGQAPVASGSSGAKTS